MSVCIPCSVFSCEILSGFFCIVEEWLSHIHQPEMLQKMKLQQPPRLWIPGNLEFSSVVHPYTLEIRDVPGSGLTQQTRTCGDKYRQVRIWEAVGVGCFCSRLVLCCFPQHQIIILVCLSLHQRESPTLMMGGRCSAFEEFIASVLTCCKWYFSAVQRESCAEKKNTSTW